MNLFSWFIESLKATRRPFIFTLLNFQRKLWRVNFFWNRFHPFPLRSNVRLGKKRIESERLGIYNWELGDNSISIKLSGSEPIDEMKFHQKENSLHSKRGHVRECLGEWHMRIVLLIRVGAFVVRYSHADSASL